MENAGQKNEKVDNLVKSTMEHIVAMDHDSQNFFIKKLYNEIMSSREKEKKRLAEETDALQRANNSLGAMFR